MEWMYLLITLISFIAAVLGWTNKLIWAKEYRDAKNETIRVKDAEIALLKTQIENLQTLTSSRMRESFVHMKQHLEESISMLETGIKEKDKQITELQASEDKHEDEITELTTAKEKLARNVRRLRKIIKDEVVNHLDEFIYTVVILRLINSNDNEFQSFLRAARAVGDMPFHKCHYTMPSDGNYEVVLRYSKNVSKRSVDHLLQQMSLKVAELQYIQGYDFESHYSPRPLESAIAKTSATPNGQ